MRRLDLFVKRKVYCSTLAYRGIRDGFSYADYRHFVNFETPRIIFIKSTKDFVFGFCYNGLHHFLFSLTKNGYCRYNFNKNWKKINNTTFNIGEDIVISEDCNNNKDSYSHLGFMYSVPENCKEDSRTYFAGEQYFQVKEIEVYNLEFADK
jgi:hypothetical protein